MRNKSRILILGAMVAGTAAMYVYGQNLTSLGLQPGEWEFTSVTQIPAALGNVGNLPPALQETIRQRLQQPHTYDKCVTAKNLADFDISNPDDDIGKCTVTSQTADGNVVDVERTCGGIVQKIHVDATSSQNVNATANVVSPAGTTTVTITAKWLGATCTSD